MLLSGVIRRHLITRQSAAVDHHISTAAARRQFRQGRYFFLDKFDPDLLQIFGEILQLVLLVGDN